MCVYAYVCEKENREKKTELNSELEGIEKDKLEEKCSNVVRLTMVECRSTVW